MQIPHIFKNMCVYVTRKVSKGAWRMPWLSEAMKDVISCDKPRGGAKMTFDPRISEWDNPVP